MYHIAETFHWINFFVKPKQPLHCRDIQCDSFSQVLYKIYKTKISPMRTGGEIGKMFLLAKTSGCMVCTCVYITQWNVSNAVTHEPKISGCNKGE